MRQDLRNACRMLWRAKAFTAAAVLTLALGLASTITMFALVQGVLLRPLPVHEQDRLILAWKEARTSGSARYPFGSTDIETVARASTLLVAAAGVTRNGVGRTVIVENGRASYANVGLVTGGFFDVLGVRPLLGRTLIVRDDREGAEQVIVISAGLWRRRYGGDRHIVGRRITFDGRHFTIVGVMPPDLDYPTGVEIWRTTTSVPTSGPFGAAARYEVNLIGRLRPGATVEQAASEISSLSQRLADATPNAGARNVIPVVRSFPDVIIGDVRAPMLALMGAVALVLLIACANVANLLLLRGEARRREMAVRAALGAGRARLLRQVFSEGLVLSALAGAIGLAVAWASLRSIVTLIPDGLPRVESIRVDPVVVLFALAAVLVIAVLASVAPAVLPLRRDLLSSLRKDTDAIAGVASMVGRRVLVVAQVALAVAVLAAAGVLIRSVVKLQSVDLGLPADRLVLVDLQLPDGNGRYDDRRQHARFLDDAIARLEAAPGIAGATPINIAPFTDQGWDVPQFTAEGQDVDRAVANPSLNLESIHPNYFATLRIPIVRGRAFTNVDRQGAPDVAIVSADVAERVWPRDDPIGKRMKFGLPGSPGGWLTIVGVAEPTRYRTVIAPRPTLYLPAAQFQMTATMMAVRTAAPVEQLTAIVTDRMAAIDPDVRVMRVVPFTDMLARPLARPTFNAMLLIVFSIAALLLPAIGLYAVMTAFVRQRDREIAVRLALGATTRTIRLMVAAEAVRLAGAGLLIGIGAALAGTRALRGMLFEVEPFDPLSLTVAVLLLVSAAALAFHHPLRRATRADIMTVLRND